MLYRIITLIGGLVFVAALFALGVCAAGATFWHNT